MMRGKLAFEDVLPREVNVRARQQRAIEAFIAHGFDDQAISEQSPFDPAFVERHVAPRIALFFRDPPHAARATA